MKNSKGKSHFKAWLAALTALCLTVLLLANALLAWQKQNIALWLSKQSNEQISIERIFFLPPNYVFIKGLKIPGKIDSGLSYASIRISKSLLEKRLCLSRINLSNSIITLQPDPSLFFDFLKNACQEDLSFSLKDCLLRYTPKSGPSKDFRIDALLASKKGAISSSGSLSRFNFKFNGSLMPRGLYIEKLKFSDKNINCELWGWSNPSVAELKGFCLINETGLNIKGAEEAFILNIDSRISYAHPLLEIERLNFLINNNPVKIKLIASLEPRIKTKLDLQASLVLSKENNLPLNLRINALLNSMEDKKVNIDGQLFLNFLSKKNGEKEEVKLNLGQLVLPLKAYPVFNLDCQEFKLVYKTAAYKHQLHLSNLSAKLSLQDKNSKIAEYKADFYKGFVTGNILVALGGHFPSLSILTNLSGVDAYSLTEISPYFQKIHGTLSAQASLVNYPEPVLKGKLDITNGSFENFDFFIWVADLFNLPALKDIPFELTKADFNLGENSISLSNIYLDSKKLKVKGNFRLGLEGEVASRISLDSSRELLEESKKFSRLLRILRKDTDFLTFNFQFSGNIKNMNFQWLESDFKEELRKRIPNFMQRQMENQIIGIIKSITQK